MAVPGRWAFNDAGKVQEMVDDYFLSLKRTRFAEVWEPEIKEKVWKEIPDGLNMPGLAGLAYHIGINRRSILNWCDRATDEDADEEIRKIAHVLVRAKAKIEAYQEAGLFDREAHKGSAFSLTVNYGWRDGAGAENERAEGFVMNVIAPVVDTTEVKAIPKWEPKEE